MDLEKTRFELELEFVQLLGVPKYLKYLKDQGYFSKPAFRAYIKYLQYWKEPAYSKFLKFPQCLFYLDIIQDPAFIESLTEDRVSALQDAKPAIDISRCIFSSNSSKLLPSGHSHASSLKSVDSLVDLSVREETDERDAVYDKPRLSKYLQRKIEGKTGEEEEQTVGEEEEGRDGVKDIEMKDREEEEEEGEEEGEEKENNR
ncbi:Mediator complex, subunit Med31 like protein [Aduncisulcus paluster]|uniref:Mediator of RNA polymerase II transcription subunit 31 n=1 Tax=Aduncisulcus paluster TaxID=2918883 RepID=A0ABQ5L0M1_9EUKA|nr:Mediator complex, subunit Med31 like protein [Aduncisulcus paluster]